MMVSVGFAVTSFRSLLECRSVGAVGQALYDDRSMRATYKIIQISRYGGLLVLFFIRSYYCQSVLIVPYMATMRVYGSE